MREPRLSVVRLVRSVGLGQGLARGQGPCVRGLVVAAVAVGAGWFSGCERYPESEYPKAPPPHVSPEPRPLEPAPPGVIWRQDVLEALEAGLGRFLQRLELAPEMNGSEFIGFRIVSLNPPDFWQGIDLRAGDIVQKVNGMPIERATEAHAAFESLREAESLVVSYLRAREAHTLTYRIELQPNAPVVPPSAKPPSTEPSSTPPPSAKPGAAERPAAAPTP
jgi:hypothetical protein